MYFSNSNLYIPFYSLGINNYEKNVNKILRQTHISDIRLVKERQKLILDFKNNI